MVATLTLMHCTPDLRALTLWAERHHWLGPQGDLGYALHALLRSAMGEAAPQPFVYLGERAGLLAYSRLTPEQLQQCADLATPEVSQALGLHPSATSHGLSAKPFPTQWQAGQTLAFDVRLRPIVRTGAGPERDVFLAAIERAEAAGETAPTSREAVYRTWLGQQLTQHTGAVLLEAHMSSFRLSDVVRRTQAGDPGSHQPETARRKRHVGGPEANFSGLLQVGDPAAFAAGMARGLGRHRAFGFGMLLLKPAFK